MISYDLNYRYIEGHYYQKGKQVPGTARITPKLPNKKGTESGHGKLASANIPNKISNEITEDGPTITCTDWYLVIYYYDQYGDFMYSTETYLTTTCTSSGYVGPPPVGGGSEFVVIDCAGVPNGTAFNSPCGCIGGNTGITKCYADQLDSILKDTCLNATQMTSLRNMFTDYLDGQGDDDLKCAQKAVYNKVKTLGKKFSLCINSAQVPDGGNASYKPGSGIIYYKFEEGIPVVTPFQHEFFHGFQDAFYTGGTAQYNTGTRTGFPNIEFEQALFYDIVNGSSSASAMGSTASQALQDEYKDWINTITNGNTEYPKQFSDFGDKYYYFLNKFHQNANGYSGGLVKTDLPPNALLNIFSSSNCK